MVSLLVSYLTLLIFPASDGNSPHFSLYAKGISIYFKDLVSLSLSCCRRPRVLKERRSLSRVNLDYIGNEASFDVNRRGSAWKLGNEIEIAIPRVAYA
jgi:hypothetical protein